MDEQCKALIDAAWERINPERRLEGKPFGGDYPPYFLEGGISWSCRLTSPLPAVWPSSGNLALYYYAYATGLDLADRLHDGVYLASPWAIIEVMTNKDSLPELTWLCDTLLFFGIQGVRPLTAAEVSLYEMWPRERVVNFLTQYHTARRDNESDRLEFRAFFCMEMSHNCIYQELRSRHEAFYRWLGCKFEYRSSIGPPPPMYSEKIESQIPLEDLIIIKPRKARD